MPLWTLVLVASGLLAEESSSTVPVASWDFSLNGEQTPTERLLGDAAVQDRGPRPPEFPDFGESNGALQLSAGSSLRVADHVDGRFDFDNGDAITLEAWVDLNRLSENAYVIGKGRTNNPDVARDNQNWALRLRSNKGAACVNFLFRSRSPSDGGPGQWHRWTSHKGFAPGSGWHHIAVTYRFGEPDSIRGFLDGEAVEGQWDMDGPTQRPPVVDDDEIWIGSSLAGDRGNSLDGAIDGVAVYRDVLSAKVLQDRFHYVPQPVGAVEVPEGKVVMQLFGPISGTAAIPQRTGALLTSWTQDELAFVRLPRKYDDWGIREDWGNTLLVRATTNVALPAGAVRLLVRSRGLSRLWIDDAIVATTPQQQNRGSAHHVVDPLPEVPWPGMRPHAMNDQERVVDWVSDGAPHRIVFEAIVGGPGYRPEFGESCVAVDSPDNPLFALLAPHRDFPLTDAGWNAFVDKQSRALDQLDAVSRRQAATESAGYWQQRHAYASKQLLSHRPDDRDIDTLLAARLAAASAAQAGGPLESEDADFFAKQVQPIFAQHCYRCHGDKEQGGLNLQDRENLLTGGDSESPAVVPGQIEQSQLFDLVSAPADGDRMPPQGDGLSESQLAILGEWIQRGAVMPAQQTIASTELVARAELADPIDDYTFLRRVYLDTVGVAPSILQVQAFLSDPREDRRQRWIDQLLNDPRLADNWVGYWQDTLAENPNLLKPMLNNTGPFRWWIHEALVDNKPLDRFATELIMMRGSTWDGGTAGFAVASQNDAPMAAKALVIGSAFLGVQMKCARCHDSPYHQTTQADLFQMAAMLNRNALSLPESSSVPAAFFEAQERESLIKATVKPGETLQPHWPFESLAPDVPDGLLANQQDTRERLAARVTLSRRFAELMANRVWARLMGRGLVEPVDDWEGHPPCDPQLLEYLADHLIAAKYDLRSLCREIMNSDAYQRAAIDHELGDDPQQRFFNGPYRRRMSAEQIVDTAVHALGKQLETEALTLDVEGTLPPENFLNFGQPRRAWEFTTLANERDRPSLALPRAQAIIDVMKAFGWRDSRPEPLGGRDQTADLIQPAVLANGVFGTWLTRFSETSGLTELALEDQPLEDFVEDLFLGILTRPPSDAERERFVAVLAEGYDERCIPVDQQQTPPAAKRFRYVSWSNHLNTEANEIKVEMEELVRQGPAPTTRLRDDWRERAEDAAWALLNSPEMILIP